MKATEVMKHFREVGTWVNWDESCDAFLHGDPEAQVRGIATTWIPTNRVLRQAAQRGLNLVITHEPAFYHAYEGTESVDRLIAEKKGLLDQHGIALIRCHDTWDRMPQVGIPDAWASFLGFDTEERQVESYYKICLLGELTVEEAARRVLAKVRSLGQETVLILGDRNKAVRRMAVGTGAITFLPAMYELDPDLILATDDGMDFWGGGHWAVDLGMPVLIVNHATAEKPGMQAMARYLRQQFPGTPTEYLDAEMPYSTV
ncbi:MAG: Nif3-like dinuclear metal center hexameric protein [Candidatus Brocadiia bacterium]|jgi:putative NIF3 family GTP cyclohydrolase 1 type 2|nr:Nif3-like dinuclear metal center hexameric protein [Candidatus Brocadiia bacterium]